MKKSELRLVATAKLREEVEKELALADPNELLNLEELQDKASEDTERNDRE